MGTGEKISSGTWGDTQWNLYTSKELPEAALVTAAGCVAIRDLATKEVVLTYTPNRNIGNGVRVGQWEILGGHLDPIDPEDPENDARETPEMAVRREALEEGGFYVGRMGLFAHREIINPPDSEYPQLGYYPFYWAISGERLGKPTDPEQPATGIFTLGQLDNLVHQNLMNPVERHIVRLGIGAALEDLQ